MVRNLYSGPTPVPRSPTDPPPCWRCPKIPDDAPKHWSSAQELSEKNRKAYRHYLHCRAVRRWPKDPIVERNAMILEPLHEEYDRMMQAKWIASMIAGMQTKG
jgi:hypothetical protein